MALIKTKEEIRRMEKAGKLLAACHREIAKRIRPGITPQEIDRFVEEYLERHGASAEQKGYMGYPYATCASINDVICHGMPGDEPLREGDIITVDFVVNLNGWLADSAWSYPVGTVSKETERLLFATRKALYAGIRQAVPGNRIGHISHAIQIQAETRGFSVVRQFIGHGIGQRIHEPPDVPHFGLPDSGPVLREGMVITIEPMLNTGSHQARIEADGWTARTVDGGLSAQYEHTVAITDDGPLVLTEQYTEGDSGEPRQM
ncbi:type I methionyl aminopeptidase [Paludifilum halophilum]|uniref:Methionine aminopeptidase n=1 Tax=Paludifilum halophilum TaxID=1642702 RepID=A0A235B7J7_9BACL|nr:type I methionyl aminopeptidase [Paludifilum halophilum]OYD08288.1 type I methionyl aminopeptidase [Paludifilum halophilum]